MSKLAVEPSQGIALLPSLVVWQGMVYNNGMPKVRVFPKEITLAPKAGEQRIETKLFPTHELHAPRLGRYGQPEYSKADLEKRQKLLELFQECVAKQRLPHFVNITNKDDNEAKVFTANVFACTRPVRLEDLKAYLNSAKRIDIEQAVALIISFLGPHNGSRLIPFIGELFLRAHMWLDPHDHSDGKTIQDGKLERLIAKLNVFLVQEEIILSTHDLMQFYQVLQRCRRSSPPSRCLRMPKWLLTELDIEEPVLNTSNIWPERPRGPDAIVLNKHRFNIFERLLQRHNGRNDEASILRRDIDALSEKMTYGGSKDTLLASKDPISVAFSFIALQRRIQLTVVSDSGWTTFLEAGEAKNVSQNRSGYKLSSFELALAQLALERHDTEIDYQALTSVVLPPGLESYVSGKSDFALGGIDQACLLMEHYVRVHGYGRMSNLTFKRGVHGDARGPVDQYNDLVDILYKFKKLYEAGTSSGGHKGDIPALPGPCQKFLAKDIMHWNNSWKDDAFACEKIPGWFDWLRDRRASGAIPAPQSTVSQ